MTRRRQTRVFHGARVGWRVCWALGVVGDGEGWAGVAGGGVSRRPLICLRDAAVMCMAAARQPASRRRALAPRAAAGV